jgi:signal transduction histidine kinase
LNYWAEQVLELWQTEPIDRELAQDIGHALAGLASFQPAALGKIQQGLSEFFAKTLSPEQSIILLPRLFGLLSELATGFVRQSTEMAGERDRVAFEFMAGINSELSVALKSIVALNLSLQGELQKRGHEDLLHYTQEIDGASKKMLQLQKDVLDIRRDFWKRELHPETLDIAAVIQDVVNSVQPMISKKGLALRVQCDAEIGSMYADSLRVRQILLNLISNACKYTEKGTITLSARRETKGEEELIVFRIADTGVGIPPERQKILFIWPLRRDLSKMCLGLSISDRFCRMMGGSIAVESQVGQGSTFSVYLPVRQKGVG